MPFGFVFLGGMAALHYFFDFGPLYAALAASLPAILAGIPGFRHTLRSLEILTCPHCGADFEAICDWMCPTCHGHTRGSIYGRCYHCNNLPNAFCCPICSKTMLLTKASLTWDKELVDKNTAKPVINPPSAPTSADPLAPDIQAVIEEAVRSTTSKRYPAPAIFKPYLKGLAQLLRIELPTPETRAGVVRLLADRIDALTTWLPSYLCAAVSSPVSVPLGHLVYPTDLVEIPETLPTLLYGALRPMILTAPSKEIDPSFHLRSLIERRAMEHNKKPLHTDSLLTSLISATPFKGFFATPVPVPLPYEQRFQHTQIIGGSGAGKTQLLQHLILHDLKTEPRPSIVVIDSQGALIKNISRLALFDYKPPIIISPKSPSAINIFDVKRLGTYDETEKEQVIAAAIETLDYLFSGFGIELTGKQGILFRYSVRLMLALKTAGHTPTILDMVALQIGRASCRERV